MNVQQWFTYECSLPNVQQSISHDLFPFFRSHLNIHNVDHVVIIGRSWSFWHDRSPIVLWSFMFWVGIPSMSWPLKAPGYLERGL